MSRTDKLTRNGHLALGLAVPPAVFLASSIVGADAVWQSTHTGMAAAVVVFAGAAVLCYGLAPGVTHPRVTHRVTHPTRTPLSPTPKQGK